MGYRERRCASASRHSFIPSLHLSLSGCISDQNVWSLVELHGANHTWSARYAHIPRAFYGISARESNQKIQLAVLHRLHRSSVSQHRAQGVEVGSMLALVLFLDVPFQRLARQRIMKVGCVRDPGSFGNDRPNHPPLGLCCRRLAVRAIP